MCSEAFLKTTERIGNQLAIKTIDAGKVMLDKK